MNQASAAGLHWRRLAVALAVSAAILIIELVAGLVSNSLALLADAGHMFADVVGMGLSLGAIRIASRPRTTGRTFGLYRLEILAASLNAVILLGIGILVLVEAVRRFAEPPDVGSTLVVVVAAVALFANAATLRFLGHSGQQSLNWHQADAVASIVIAVLIVPRAVALLRDSVDVLMEATPKGVDMVEVERHILEAPGVRGVHDLHAWTITSGMHVVSAHVVLEPDAVPGDILDHLGRCLSDDFDIDHSTFQLETPDHVRWEAEGAMTQH